jgi:hypothetical protein
VSTKDILTLVLSGLALVISLISAWFSAKRQKIDSERQFRGRLTDIGVAMIDSVLKIQKLDAIPYTDRSADHLHERGIELQRTVALARQADRLITKDAEKLLTDVDYLTLAQAFAMDGDTFLADRYWARTLRASQRPLHSATNKSNYAWYLFSTNRPDDARSQYESAVIDLTNSIESEGDWKYLQIGWFYEGWMRMEAQFGFADDASVVRERARDAYAQIVDERERTSRISSLDESFERAIGAAGVPPMPGSVNPSLGDMSPTRGANSKGHA